MSRAVCSRAGKPSPSHLAPVSIWLQQLSLCLVNSSENLRVTVSPVCLLQVRSGERSPPRMQFLEPEQGSMSQLL